MNPKINPKNTIKAPFWVKIDSIFSMFLKAKYELHKMTFHITIDREII
jgi:hypothetical protein